jgi:antitoxin ParD1/3/4
VIALGIYMNIQKLSISLSRQQYEFLENYQESHHYKTRSEVIRKALYLLQQAQLEACYKEANQELDDAFDITTSDGLEEDETW